ncbi:MAG: HAD hydrolase-like protein [Deltaproteobacteria bacterium]|nr:HAD hydrolase-like protein [Deltaproteobacteria bacterium]
MNYWAFDLDGTLVDSFSHYFKILDVIFQDHGARFSPEHRHTALTQPIPDFFEKHLGKAAVEPAIEKLTKVSTKDAEQIHPFDGITTAVEHLVSSGAKVAVWTNRDLISAELILKHTKLKRLAEICISGTCVVQRKPSAEGLLKISSRFGCHARDITVVGDHEHDVQAAKSVGARAVRASWHSYWTVERCTQADAQFYTVPEFTAWVQSRKQSRLN